MLTLVDMGRSHTLEEREVGKKDDTTIDIQDSPEIRSSWIRASHARKQHQVDLKSLLVHIQAVTSD